MRYRRRSGTLAIDKQYQKRSLYERPRNVSIDWRLSVYEGNDRLRDDQANANQSLYTICHLRSKAAHHEQPQLIASDCFDHSCSLPHTGVFFVLFADKAARCDYWNCELSLLLIGRVNNREWSWIYRIFKYRRTITEGFEFFWY